MSLPQSQPSTLFELQFPQSVGIYQTYAEAQKAVDFLADEKFPVENLAIVGTDLKSVERVLGRRNWGTVIGQGVQSGLSTGLLVALLLLLFTPPGNFLVLLLSALAIGVAIGVAFAAAAYALSKGRRDFTSVTQTVATKYEVLCEHKMAAQARELLQRLPGARAAAFE
ncbi:MAG: general stress protein [Actinomycetes bacterium]